MMSVEKYSLPTDFTDRVMKKIVAEKRRRELFSTISYTILFSGVFTAILAVLEYLKIISFKTLFNSLVETTSSIFISLSNYSLHLPFLNEVKEIFFSNTLIVIISFNILIISVFCRLLTRKL